jgi:hypothetical protein
MGNSSEKARQTAINSDALLLRALSGENGYGINKLTQ